MERLSDCVAARPKDHKPQKGRSVVQIRDKRTGQALIIDNDGRLEAYDLEEASWEEGEAHTDGVVVGDLDGDVVVVFIELTGSLDDNLQPKKQETSSEHKLRQLDGAVKHFHPYGRTGGVARTHGDVHHDCFANGEDPVDPAPAPNHRVLAIAVAERQGSRLPTPPVVIGPTTVTRQFRSISHPRRQVPTIRFRDLCDAPE